MKVKFPLPLALSIISLVAGLTLFFLFSRPFSPQEMVENMASNLSAELDKIERDAEKILEKAATSDYRNLIPESTYPFIIYDRQQVVAWSDNIFVPSQFSVADNFSLKLLKDGNGDYLAKKWKINDNEFLVAVIPLYRKFNITNDYLNTWWNTAIFSTGSISILEPNASLGIAVCAKAQCPFKVSFLPYDPLVHDDVQSIIIVFLSLAIIGMTLHVFKLAKTFAVPELGFIVLYLYFLGLRYLMVSLNFPASFYPSGLFDPEVFASSTLNASLGDLLLNELVILLLCIFLFKNYQRFKIFQYLYKGNWIAWLLSVIAGLCIQFALLFPFVSIQTIYNNSAIVLDISQSLDFDTNRSIALLIVLISGVCSFLFAHTFIRLLIADGNRTRVLISFVASVIAFVSINSTTGQQFYSSLAAAIVYFLLIYFLRLYSGLKRLTFATFSYLFIAISVLSANGAFAVHYFTLQEKINSQFKFADNFLIDRDIFAEYLLHETAMQVSKDAFIQTRINTPFLNRDAIRQKIRQVFLPTYFNKYDVQIYLFGSSGEPLNNRDESSLSEFIGVYDQDAYRTPYEGVYFVSSPAKDVAQKYLVRVAVLRGGSTLGYIMLELSLKKIIPENVYPELLVDNSFQQFYHAQDISYAVFADTTILFSSGKFNYDLAFERKWMRDPKIQSEGVEGAGYIHISRQDQNGRIAVVSSQLSSRTYALANFSFLLVLSLAMILVFLLIQGGINYFEGEKLYFSARIQLLLNLAFFLPLILVSITTLNLTSRSSQNQLNDEYMSKAESFSGQLVTPLDDYLKGTGETVVSFQNQLTDLAKLTNLDANVFSSRGELIATSQPQIFEGNLVSIYVNPRALQKIRQGENIVIETEKVGKLEYYVSYAALKAPLTGKLIGILAIPFFQSAYLMEKVMINIVANILNIFALIFITLVILSYFVSLWLTFPLKFITQSLQRTSLTKVNQPLTWKSDDEIGLMVKEYNQMLFKLSESKAELEQTQRERTWREIAQQVAHEIKNPLTPMKLTLQQLQRQVQSRENGSEKIERAISSLLIQVDTLNDIASSFSTFAKMPEPVMHRIELVGLVKRIALLHSQSGDLSFNTALREAFITGDEQLLGRTFSNIILNAFQAAKPGHPQQLKIGLEKGNAQYLLTFQDNGKGIEPQIVERIFLSHFSTKKSGSGIGLAIAKQAIEQMNGRIWFDTVVGQGTTFYIELPAR